MLQKHVLGKLKCRECYILSNLTPTNLFYSFQLQCAVCVLKKCVKRVCCRYVAAPYQLSPCSSLSSVVIRLFCASALPDAACPPCHWWCSRAGGADPSEDINLDYRSSRFNLVTSHHCSVSGPILCTQAKTRTPPLHLVTVGLKRKKKKIITWPTVWKLGGGKSLAAQGWFAFYRALM